MSWKPWLAFSCTHGHLVNHDVLRALIKFKKHWNPVQTIHLGDVHDWGALRKGIRSDEAEGYSDMIKDEAEGYMTLRKLEPTVVMKGNHDYRLDEIANSHANGMIRRAAKEGVDRFNRECRAIKAKVFPYHHEKGVYSMDGGKTRFVHGNTANKSSVSEHAEHYGCPGGKVIMGHLHRLEFARGKKNGGVDGYCAGMIADKNLMAYANRRLATSLWRNAWLYGASNGKESVVWMAQEIGGRWLLPTGWEEL